MLPIAAATFAPTVTEATSSGDGLSDPSGHHRDIRLDHRQRLVDLIDQAEVALDGGALKEQHELTPTPSAAPGVLFPPAPDEAAQCDSRDRGQLPRCLAHADPLCRRPIAEEAGGVGARRADRDLVLAFLDELEEKRNNSVTTRNARLAAIRSFFRHVAAADPASFGVAQRVLTIPIKRTHIDVTYHLTTAEVDTLIAAPDPKTPRGRRDRAFLLFLGTNRRPASEATGVNANDLQLERPHPQVLLRGKGRRDRVVPIAKDPAAGADILVERARDRPSRAATDIPRRPQRAPGLPDRLWPTSPYRRTSSGTPSP
ncbi:Phage integrase, N-terminal SAM-like domain [Mesorhizobium muleiense]|uniref:Phage integrase, N-terminal SAM-like domain n=1 Tax=Mesorhizobium muleiense TaxID=1004279 RepID=A0A1G9KZ99_9HYPH|nr:Phage integrase, N-terminal SAM-like domain [Mesorhizobium muleiense]